MKRTLLTWLIVGCIGTQVTVAQKLSPEDRREITTFLEEQLSADDPGLAVGIIQDGQVILEEYLGLANMEHQVPVDANSRFNIASVAKQFTALATLNLILEKKLALEDDIRKYLPELYPEVKAPILIRHLLNHTSGIRDYYDLLSIKQDPWWRKEAFDNEDAYEILKDQKELNFEPGSQYLYSNSNYTLLARIIARVSGQTFHDYTRTFFDALGMSNTFFLKDYMHVIPYLARPYADWGDGIWQEYPMMTNLFGDGFLFTTLPDQLAFELRVQAAKTSLMTVSQGPIKDAEITTYGYGLELKDRLGLKSVHHSGGTGAYNAQTVRYPDQKLTVIVMSSNSKIWSGYIADKTASILLPEKGKKELDDQLDASEYAAKSTRSSLLGEYQGPLGGIIRITETKGKLIWQQANNNPIELNKIKGSLYEWAQNSKVKAGFTTEGFTVYYPGSEPRFFKKMETFEATKNYLNDLIGTYSNAEIEVEFEISMAEDFGLLIYQKEIGEQLPLEVVQEDNLLVSDYILKVNRDASGNVSNLLVTFSRLKNLRFEKVESKQSRMAKYTSDGGQIHVGTTSDTYGKGKGDILLTKNYENGNEEWNKLFGGKSYDKASAVSLTKDGGYLIVGSTSSFGNGNYDVWVIKVNSDGEEEWNKTFGDVGNEYGVSATETEAGYVVKGQKQTCPEDGMKWEECETSEWIFELDEMGRL